MQLDKCPCGKLNPLPPGLSSLLGRAEAKSHKLRLGWISVMSKCQGLLGMPHAGTFPVKHVAPSWTAWAGPCVLQGARQGLALRDHMTQEFHR